MPRVLVVTPNLRVPQHPYRDLLAAAGFEIVFPAEGARLSDSAALIDQLQGIDASIASVERYTPEVLAAFASGVADGLRDRLAADRPLYLALDGDIAQSLGTLLRTEFGAAAELVVLDGLELWDFDFIDLSRLQLPSRTVVVTIKSLIFDDGRARRAPHAD